MAIKKSKATTKKVVARKVVKKSVKKTPAVIKVSSRITPAHVTLDLYSLFSEVPISKSFRNIADVIEKTNGGIPPTKS